MKIQVVSDLHTEFGESGMFMPCNIQGDVLLVAGDTGSDPQKIREFLLRYNKVPIIIVLGNHEFYGNDLSEIREQYAEALFQPGDNLFLLDNKELTLPQFPGYTFFGSTLWTDLLKADEDQIQQYMNDYHLIKKNGWKIKPEFTKGEHSRAKMFLDSSMSACRNKKIVLTHHLPSFQSVPIKYMGHFLNAAYASNLEELIYNHQPVLWVHGHTHDSKDFYLENTRIVCNPHGYYKQGENCQFNPEFVIEV